MCFFIFFDFFSILLLSSLDVRDLEDEDDEDLLLDLSLLMGGLLSCLLSDGVAVGALTSSVVELCVTSAWGFGASTFGAAGLTSPQLAITTLLRGLSPGWVGIFSILSHIS